MCKKGGRMKKLALFAFMAVFVVAMIAEATEVVEVAKKEKARREAIQKQGKPAKVFTNQDIGNLKATLGFEVRTEPEQIKDTTLPRIDTSAGEVEQPKPAQPKQEQNNEEVEKLKQEREAMEQQAKDAQQTINQGGGYHTRNIGTQYKLKREAETRIREIDKELEEKEGKKEE
jgi:hypothetical protein